MPVQLTAPGVYIEEIPSGVRTITGVATSITAFVGRTKWGPVAEPTLLGSFGEFERKFGGLWQDSPLSYAVRDFYLNGGSQALIVRLFKPGVSTDGVAKTASLGGAYGSGSAGGGGGGLLLEASSPGEWGNKLTVSVDTNVPGDSSGVAARLGVATADLFNLTVTYDGVQEVVVRNVTVKESARRVDRVLEQESRLVRVQKSIVTGLPLLPLPAVATNVPFTGGSDSVALTSTELIGSEGDKTGLFSLEKADLFNLLCIPPDTRAGATPDTVYQAAFKYCEKRRAMLVVDSDGTWNSPSAALAGVTTMGLTGPAGRNAAIYFPRVVEADPLREGQPDTFVPCGIVAGVMAATDATRGVWKAPAGIDAAMTGVQRLSVDLTDLENGTLNDEGVNCFRAFPVFGRVVWGARTMRGANQLADEYKYVPVRRLALYIEESLYRGLKWVVFEGNDEPLWAQIRLNVGAFMHTLFLQGAFQGKSSRDAYLVKCDKETTTQDDINRGVVNILVGFAPLKPAEFVILKLQQLAGQIAV
ncbi:MAG TPA: phage tail sheath C-terminal domain-containing protein [Myxococcota bacterium]|jgi:hypothetical protein|nr:phage tail sheath C-terminal domain-containing protein [Myxococcota bacterium]